MQVTRIRHVALIALLALAALGCSSGGNDSANPKPVDPTAVTATADGVTSLPPVVPSRTVAGPQRNKLSTRSNRLDCPLSAPAEN